MSGKALLIVVLVLGVAAGTVVSEMNLASKSADQLCNQHLPGEQWTANATLSEDLDGATRLACVHENGTTRSFTVNISIDWRKS